MRTTITVEIELQTDADCDAETLAEDFEAYSIEMMEFPHGNIWDAKYAKDLGEINVVKFNIVEDK